MNDAGNLVARGADAFTYDAANRLKTASVGGTASSYAYDGDGKRASKTVGGSPTNYVYDVNASLPVLLDDGTRKYVWGLGLAFAVDTSGSPIVYHADGLGSVRALTNATGTVVQTYLYDEYGNVVSSQGSITQPFGYTGEVSDAETGLVYLRARYYEGAIGRFIGRDRAPGIRAVPLTLNRYSYVRNSPMSLLDPSGLYEYRYEWRIGPVSRIGSPEAVMGYFQQHPREIFPFDLGQCNTIEYGECDLGVVLPVLFGRDVVVVSGITSTSFLFTATDQHFDPPGSTIRFSTFEREGDVYLQQKARALRDDWLDKPTAFAAKLTWGQQAENLKRAVDPMGRFLEVPYGT